MARLLLVESLAGGPALLERRGEVGAQLIAAVDDGRSESKLAPQLPPLTAEGTSGGVVSILQNVSSSGALEPLSKLINPLMALIVTPYLGTAAARRELDRPVEPARRQPPEGASIADPFKAGRHASHLPHGPRAAGDSGEPGRVKPPDRRSRRDARPGPDLKAARTPQAPSA